MFSIIACELVAFGSNDTCASFVSKFTSADLIPSNSPMRFFTAFTQCPQLIPSTLSVVFSLISDVKGKTCSVVVCMTQVT